MERLQWLVSHRCIAAFSQYLDTSGRREWLGARYNALGAVYHRAAAGKVDELRVRMRIDVWVEFYSLCGVLLLRLGLGRLGAGPGAGLGRAGLELGLGVGVVMGLCPLASSLNGHCV